MSVNLSTIRRFLECLDPDPRVIKDRAGEAAYLTRHYLMGRPTMPDGSAPWVDGQLKSEAEYSAKEGGVYLHRFHQSDTGWMHNHPWEWAFSLVLEHGYVEHRGTLSNESLPWLSNDARAVETKSRLVEPGQLNFITHEDFHLVSLLRDEHGNERQATTIFFVGPKTRSWGFLDADQRKVVPWRDYVEANRGPGGVASLRK